MPWFRPIPEGWLLTLHVQPGAKTSAVSGLHGEALKIRIAAPPLEGRANAALITFIAAQLGVAKQLVSVERGSSSRHKTVRIADSGADPGKLYSG